jgi:hypothetical protein
MRGFGEGTDVTAGESLWKDTGSEVVSETGCLRFAVCMRLAESVYQLTVWRIHLEQSSPIEVTVPSSAISAATNLTPCFPILDSDVKLAEHKPSSGRSILMDQIRPSLPTSTRPTDCSVVVITLLAMISPVAASWERAVIWSAESRRKRLPSDVTARTGCLGDVR